MARIREPWNDENRFNQTGYSGGTLFPIRTNYQDEISFKEDLAKAKAREENHQEFLDEQRQESYENLAEEKDEESEHCYY